MPIGNCTKQAKNEAPNTTKKAGSTNIIVGLVPSSIMDAKIQPTAKKMPKKFI